MCVLGRLCSVAPGVQEASGLGSVVQLERQVHPHSVLSVHLTLLLLVFFWDEPPRLTMRPPCLSIRWLSEV